MTDPETQYLAKLDYSTPPRPTALVRITEHLAEYFDKATMSWQPDPSLHERIDDDIDFWPVTAADAARIEETMRGA